MLKFSFFFAVRVNSGCLVAVTGLIARFLSNSPLPGSHDRPEITLVRGVSPREGDGALQRNSLTIASYFSAAIFRPLP